MFLRYRVVTAGIERIAAQYAPDSQARSFYQSVFSQSFQGVLRAGRRKAAAARQKGRDAGSVKLHQGYHKPGSQTRRRQLFRFGNNSRGNAHLPPFLNQFFPRNIDKAFLGHHDAPEGSVAFLSEPYYFPQPPFDAVAHKSLRVVPFAGHHGDLPRFAAFRIVSQVQVSAPCDLPAFKDQIKSLLALEFPFPRKRKRRFCHRRFVLFSAFQAFRRTDGRGRGLCVWQLRRGHRGCSCARGNHGSFCDAAYGAGTFFSFLSSFKS